MASNFEIIAGHPSSHVIIHVPHSARYIPDDVRKDILLSDSQLESELDQMTDSLTAELVLHATANLEVPPTLFINKYSRLVIDPERFPDEREIMNKVGMGAVYQKTSTGENLRKPDFANAELISKYFEPYAKAITDLVSEKLNEHGRVLLIDFHSYRAEQHVNAVNHGQARPPVCIGTDSFHTPQALIKLAQDKFAIFGETVLDQPYAGTYVPLSFYGIESRVQSIMLENRADLLVDGKLNPGPRFDEYSSVFAGFIAAIASN
ncbi:MAG: N-formylglutamate amidohydrolase [Candidatus Nanopelagicaceae bacterium]